MSRSMPMTRKKAESLPAKHDGGLPGTVDATFLILPVTLKFEAWQDTLRLLGRMGKGVNWWLGDAIAFGEKLYGEKFAQGLDETGYESQTLMNLAWVSRSIDPSRRREMLSWTHHECVAGQDPETQARLLGMAEDGEELPGGGRRMWSCSRLRQEVKTLRKALEEGPADPETDSQGQGNGSNDDPEKGAATDTPVPGPAAGKGPSPDAVKGPGAEALFDFRAGSRVRLFGRSCVVTVISPDTPDSWLVRIEAEAG